MLDLKCTVALISRCLQPLYHLQQQQVCQQPQNQHKLQNVLNFNAMMDIVSLTNGLAMAQKNALMVQTKVTATELAGITTCLTDLRSIFPSYGTDTVCIQSISGPFFPAFGQYTEIYTVSLCIQSECEKIRTRKTLNTDNRHVVSEEFSEPCQTCKMDLWLTALRCLLFSVKAPS